MIASTPDLWTDVAHDHIAYLNATIDNWIRTTSRPLSPLQREVEAFINRNRSIIASLTETNFSPVILDFSLTFPTPGVAEEARKYLERVFDYGLFSDKDKPGWNGYQLCFGSRYKVCPYCQLHGTETVLPGGTKGFRPDLDHILVKSIYPYLSLSLGNLITSCGQCNGPAMKGVVDFHLHKHLNPLVDAEEISFSLQPIDPANALLPDFQAFRQSPSEYTIRLSNVSEAGMSSIQVFQLVARYQASVERAHLIARRRSNQNWFRTMIAQAVGINIDILEFQPNTAEYKHAVQGKLSQDIYNSPV